MNEQAIQDAYNLFVSNGYKKSIDEFKALIASNPKALSDSYTLFTGSGYKKSIDDFKILMGITSGQPQVQPQVQPQPQVKKKEPTPSVSAVTPSVSQEPVSQFGQQLTQIQQEKPSTIPQVLTEEGKKTYVAPKIKPFDIELAIKSLQKMNEDRASEYRKDPTIVTREEKEKAIQEANDGILTREESLRNITSNAVTTIKMAVPKMNLVAEQALEKLLGRELANKLVGGNIYTGNTMDEERTKTLRDIGDLMSQMKETTGITESIKKLSRGEGGSASDLIVAAAGSLSQIVTTAIEAFGTGGISLYTDAVGGAIYDYNEERAKQKGKTIEQLFQDEEADIAVPALFGSVSFYLDKLGLEGATKMISKKLTGDFMKKSALFGWETNKEGMTEWLQEGVDAANTTIGKGGNTKDATQAAVDAMFSERGLETYLQGSVGSAALAGGGRLISKDNHNDYSKLTEENVKLLGDLKNGNIDTDTKKMVLDVLSDNKSKLDEILSFDRKVIDKLSDEDKAKVADLYVELNAKRKLKNNGNISEVLRTKVIEDVAKLETEISNIVNKVLPKKKVKVPVIKPALTPEETIRRDELQAAIDEEKNTTGIIVIGDESLTKEEAVNELQLLNKKEQDAIQKQTTDEGLLRTEQPQVGLQEVGKGDQVTEVITEEAKPKEEVALSDVKNTSDFIRSNDLARDISQNADQFFLAKEGKDINDTISEEYHKVKLDGSNPDLVKAVEDAVGRTIQEQQVVTEEVTPTEEVVTDESLVEYNPSEEIKDKDMGLLLKTLKSKKINPLAEPIITDLGDTVVFEYKTNLEDGESVDRITFERKADGSLSNKNILVQKNYVPIRNSIEFNNYIQEKRNQLKKTTTQNQTNEQATTEQPKKPSAGNRLFNQPIEAIKEIANRYYERAFGTTRPDFKGTRELDKVRAKRISDAFLAMKHAPNDPKVREAYNALAKETIDQYKAFLDAGYVVEINNEEPYANSQEMIDDLRNNKRIKIFSTESGFGDNPITDKQRNENPLLATSEFKDTNGNALLVNDLFRAVHDFFGHAELGNSFGPLGEENAWNVHARMFSPLARRAMTTETRGQNSYVNFSGVNEEVNKLRDEARQLREEGKYQEALEKTDEIYEKISFADQKVGLLPEEFSTIDEEVTTPKTLEQEVAELNSMLQVNKPIKEQSKEILDNVIKSVKTAFPDLFIQSFDTVQEMKDFAQEKYGDAISQQILGGVGGIIIYNNDKKPIGILTNIEEGDATTMPHEAWHAILIRAFGDNQKLFTEFRDSVNNILRENGYGQIADDLEIFANNEEYIKRGTQAEEWLVQLGGMLTASGIKSDSLNKESKTLLAKLKDLINQFAERIIGQPVFLSNATAEDVLDFMVAISDRMSRGENIADFFEKQERKKPTNEFKKLTNEFKTISKQIIGENANLSATVRRYLDIAKKMENEGIDELSIRIATGWERGFGGKWRYEIPYGKIKDIDLEDLKTEIDDETGKENPVAKLSDIFSAPDLYNAYNKDKIGNTIGNVTYYTSLPKVADLKVVFKKLKPNEMGAFSRTDNEIVINRDEFIKNKDEMQLTIIHEIQHYIQEVERFEKGSSPSFAIWKSKNTLNELRDNIKQLKSRYESTKKYFPDDINSLKEQKEFIKKATEAYKEFKTKVSFLAGKSPKNVEETYRSPAFDLYFRTAGEVEARLAEERSKLSASERRKILLKETSEIAAEDQIFYDEKEDVERLKAKLQRGARLTEKDIIKVGLANGFSDEAIRTVLQGRGFTEEQIDAAFGTTKEAAKKVEVTPEFAKGYKELKGKLENEFSNYIKLVDDKDKGLKFIMTKLKTSDVYRNATDVQKEKMVRDIRAIAGKKEKSAPSVDKLFGNIKDVTKITMTEKQAFAQQMKSENRGGKDAKKAWMKKSAELTKSIKTLADSGRITVKQAAAVLRKFSGVNLFDDASIDRFVEYMSKVFNNAEYAEKISNAFAKLPTAKKNAKTKLGIAESLTPALNRMLSIKPTLIPDAVLDSYLDIVDMIGKKAEVLTLEEVNSLTKKVNDILDAVDVEESKADELAERFNNYEDKVLDENGKLDYSATIKAMLKDNTISDDEAEIMRKYKSSIVEPVERVKKTEEELAVEKEQLIGAVKASTVDAENLPTRDERDLAKELASLAKTDAIKELSNNQLKNLFKTIDNINNGYLPHYAQLMVEKLNAINDAKQLASGVQKASLLPFSKLYANLKAAILNIGKKRTSGVLEMIRRNPLSAIDQLLGNYKDNTVFKAMFEKSAEAEQKYKSAVSRVLQKLTEAQEKVSQSFGNDGNKTLLSSFKMMTYMVQLEHDSNIGSKQVKQASDYLKATIKHIDGGKSEFGERDANMLQSILNDYTTDGEIDIDKLYKSFNTAEKNAIKTIREINESLTEKAVYTASVIRGDKINPLNNYVHLNVITDVSPTDNLAGVSSMEQYNQSRKPSSKAKSLIERTGKVSPLNFDVFTSAMRGANFILMDYNLTQPIRTARKTINEAKELMEKDGRIPKNNRDLLNAISDAYEEVVSNVLANNFIDSSVAEEVLNFITKQGYRAILASAPRFVSELSSNVSYALIVEPSAFTAGVGLRNVILSPSSIDIMNNVGSKETTRIYPEDTLSGRLVDTSLINQVSGIKGGKSKSDVANKAQKIYNNSLKKYKNFVELTADALISTPDKMVMRPIWFGAFANEFENVSGSKPDFDKIAANDEAYMNENKEAIEKAKNLADEKAVRAGATDSAFMGILKGTVKPNQNGWVRGFNTFNSFMTKFLMYEYVTARTGINAAMGNGSISRKQGVALIAGVTSRMLVYGIMTQMLGSLMTGLILGDDDEEDDKTFLQKIGQYTASTITGLIFGRDFGNATRTVVNFGLEKMNEEYLDFLREGEYDPYKDAIQYSIIPNDSKKTNTDLGDVVTNVVGSTGPALKTANLIIKKATEEPKKEADAIERSDREIYQRIPLELLGNTGFIPLYKDVRKVLMADMYKELRQTKGPTKKDAEQELLQGYDTREDMKRYEPELYEQTFGKGSPTYEIDKMMKDMEKQQKDMEQQMEDMMYGYTGETKKKTKKKK